MRFPIVFDIVSNNTPKDIYTPLKNAMTDTIILITYSSSSILKSLLLLYTNATIAMGIINIAVTTITESINSNIPSTNNIHFPLR